MRHDKGGNDRRTMLPAVLHEPLRRQLAEARRLHDKDIGIGLGEVWLPDALARKFAGAGREWVCQWVFVSGNRSIDPRSERESRQHLSARKR